MTVDIGAGLRRYCRPGALDTTVGRRTAGTETVGQCSVEVDIPGAASGFMVTAIHIMTDTADRGRVGITKAVNIRVQGHTGQGRNVVDVLEVCTLSFNGKGRVATTRIGRIIMTTVTRTTTTEAGPMLVAGDAVVLVVVGQATGVIGSIVVVILVLAVADLADPV